MYIKQKEISEFFWEAQNNAKLTKNEDEPMEPGQNHCFSSHSHPSSGVLFDLEEKSGQDTTGRKIHIHRLYQDL